VPEYLLGGAFAQTVLTVADLPYRRARTVVSRTKWLPPPHTFAVRELPMIGGSEVRSFGQALLVLDGGDDPPLLRRSSLVVTYRVGNRRHRVRLAP
jgi:hypothetical protein